MHVSACTGHQSARTARTRALATQFLHQRAYQWATPDILYSKIKLYNSETLFSRRITEVRYVLRITPMGYLPRTPIKKSEFTVRGGFCYPIF